MRSGVALSLTQPLIVLQLGAHLSGPPVHAHYMHMAVAMQANGPCESDASTVASEHGRDRSRRAGERYKAQSEVARALRLRLIIPSHDE